MSIEAFEKKEQILQLRARVLQAEQERIDQAATLSVSQARKQLSERILQIHKQYTKNYFIKGYF